MELIFFSFEQRIPPLSCKTYKDKNLILFAFPELSILELFVTVFLRGNGQSVFTQVTLAVSRAS